MQQKAPYKSKNKIRILTAGSLFDGHDAAINIMRRIIQQTGAEVIHMGHNRPVHEIVNAAIQEDVQGIAITSYQGGHNEFFKYAHDLLKEKGAGHIKIFGGGGGTILPDEIKDLHDYGVARIYSPDDGRALGLQGMINDLMIQCDFPIGENVNGELKSISAQDPGTIARLISAVENYPETNQDWIQRLKKEVKNTRIPVLGITGTGGAGKSSFVDELVLRYLKEFPEKTLGIISVDPSKRKTGGALLGDRIRMNAISDSRVFMRSLATRQFNLALSKHIDTSISILKKAGFDLIVLETSGIGQSDTEIVDHADISVYVMTPEYGAASQLEKIDMLDFADVVVINKFDKRGAPDALRDVKKQYQRNHQLWDVTPDEMPVYGTIASQFNDPGVNYVFEVLTDKLFHDDTSVEPKDEESEKIYVIPPNRVRYLSEISQTIREYDQEVESQSDIASILYSLYNSMKLMKSESADQVVEKIREQYEKLKDRLNSDNRKILEGWPDKREAYASDTFTYLVRSKEITVENFTQSLSHNKIPKIALPKYRRIGEKSSNGLNRKMFLVSFHIRLEFSHLREKERTLPECLLEKEDLKELINGSTIYHWVCQPSAYLLPLIQ